MNDCGSLDRMESRAPASSIERAVARVGAGVCCEGIKAFCCSSAILAFCSCCCACDASAWLRDCWRLWRTESREEDCEDMAAGIAALLESRIRAGVVSRDARGGELRAVR
jgi:hypothetical protein